MTKTARMLWRVAAAACMAAGLAPAAQADCAAFLAAYGRGYDPAAPEVAVPGAGADLMGCPAGQLYQLTHERGAVMAAQPVRAARDLTGTWVSDDFLAMASGVFIPVYEVLDIKPGSAPDTVQVTQKLIRAIDPAVWLGDDLSPMGAVDVPAAGRIATYAKATLAVIGTGEIAPRTVRFHDFPIEGDRLTSLMMKTQFYPMLTIGPTKAGRAGDRLVLEYTGRFAGEQVKTFVKRSRRAVEDAIWLAVIMEQPASLYLCLVRQMDGPTPEFAAMLGGKTVGDLSAIMARMRKLEAERGTLLDEIRSGELDDAARKAKTAVMLDLIDSIRGMTLAEPFKSLQAAAQAPAPFGCPRIQ